MTKREQSEQADRVIGIEYRAELAKCRADAPPLRKRIEARRQVSNRLPSIAQKSHLSERMLNAALKRLANVHNYR